MGTRIIPRLSVVVSNYLINGCRSFEELPIKVMVDDMEEAKEIN